MTSTLGILYLKQSAFNEMTNDVSLMETQQISQGI